MPAPRSTPIWKKTLPVAALVLALVACLAGFRIWKQQLEDAPVDALYRDYLAYVAARVPAADLHLRRYYQRYGRDTVAARHFKPICRSVTAMADQQALDLGASEWHTLAGSCRWPLSNDEIHLLP